MSNRLAKEFNPLLLPGFVAIVGSAVRPSSDIAAMLGTVACFGGFALLAAIAFGIEFQERTLGLVLSQPIERSSLWSQKLLVVFLAGIVVALLNWRVQALISELPALLLLLVWMGLLATVCSSGFWIQTTGSIFAGIALSLVNQLVVFGGLALAIGDRQGFSIPFPNTEVLVSVCFATLLYCATSLWLSRRVWTGNFVSIGTAVLGFLMLCGLSQVLSNVFGGWTSSPNEICFSVIFLLATACSACFWTLIARTIIGGAALSVASEFLVASACLLILSGIDGEEPDIHQPRFLGPVVMFSILYSGVFLWLGWRKFAALEVKDASGGESLLPTGRGWSLTYFRCRPQQTVLNLIRKELRLQKPLLMLACVFCVCWLAAYALPLLQVGKRYANVKDILTCFYIPATLLLAGCISLGDEKMLGLTTWQLALPISTRTQCVIKLAVAAISGATLGFLLPLLLYLIPALVFDTAFLPEGGLNVARAVIIISGSLFILSFWAATLLSNTVRAALSAVAFLIVLPSCSFLGGWLAERFDLLRMVLYPLINWVIIPLRDVSRPSVPSYLAILLGCVLAIGIALFQSFRQFRSIQIPIATLVRAPLVLAGVCLLWGFLAYSIERW